MKRVTGLFFLVNHCSRHWHYLRVSRPVALGREARSKQRSAGSLATGTAGKPATARTGALQVPAEKSAGSCEHELGTAAKTQVAPRGRSGTQLHSSSPPATSPQAPPLGNRGNGKGRKPGTASRCDCASWFSGPQMAASSAPSSAGAATAGAAGCSRLHHAQPSGGASGVGPRASPVWPCFPGSERRPTSPPGGRGARGEARATRTKLQASQDKWRAWSWRARRKLRERLRGDRNPGRDPIGLPGPEFLPHPPGQRPSGATGACPAFGAGLLLPGGQMTPRKGKGRGSRGRRETRVTAPCLDLVAWKYPRESIGNCSFTWERGVETKCFKLRQARNSHEIPLKLLQGRVDHKTILPSLI